MIKFIGSDGGDGTEEFLEDFCRENPNYHEIEDEGEMTELMEKFLEKIRRKAKKIKHQMLIAS